MRIRLAPALAIPAAALLSACQEQTPPAEPMPVTSEADPAPGQPAIATGVITDPLVLEGEYRVAGIDGAEVDLPHAMTVTITPGTIRYISQCVTGAWRYRFEGQAIVLEQVVEATCDRGRYPEEEGIESALAAVTHVRRTASNAVEFSGRGRTVTLFSQ
ncbi:hypothetical protein [Paraurantiacibacter namhicola]|nr:hypothetical protein [Paraurantiacibacter namhicola]